MGLSIHPKYMMAALVAIAALVRLIGINHQIYTDENKVITPSVQLAQGKQQPLLYPKGSYYPHFYHYILGIAFLPAAPADAPYPSTTTAPDTYTIIARTVTALIGAGTVYVVYVIGTRLCNPTVGGIAALLFTFLPLHVKYSHYAHVDIPLTLTTTLALMSAIYVYTTGKLRWYALTGIFIGISGATHYTGFVIGIALLIAHGIYIVRNRTYSLRTIISRNIIISLLIIPLSFAITSPYTLIRWQESVTIYKTLSLRGAAGDLGYTRPSFTWPLFTESPDWGLPFTVSGIVWESNALMILLGGIGLLIAAYKRQWQVTLLLGGTIIIMYIAIIGRLPLYAVKRLLPVTPLLALCAGWGIYHIGRMRTPHKLFMECIALAVLVVVIGQNLVTVIGFDLSYIGGSTHSNAVAWAKEHIPPTSVVLQHGPIRLLDWDDPKYKTIRMGEVYANFNASDPEVSHDRAKPLSYWVKEQGVQYIAMDSRIVDRYFDTTSIQLYPETTASYQDFYTDIRNRGTLVYRADPKPGSIAGPRVEIYDVRNVQ